MKKLLALGVSLAMLCTLAACGGDSTSTVDSTAEEFYEVEDTVAETTQEESGTITISCVESGSALTDASFAIVGEAIVTLFDQTDESWMGVEFYTASGEQAYFLQVIKDADSKVSATLVVDDQGYNGEITLNNENLGLTFDNCRFVLDEVSTVQVYLIIDGAQQMVATLDAGDIACESAASGEDGAVALTFDTATYYTYDAYGQKIDDVLQITLDGNYMQVTLFDRYQTDFIGIEDEEDNNTFYWDGSLSLSYNCLTDAQTGEEVFLFMDLNVQYGYNNPETLFFGSYEIRKADEDDWVVLVQDAGMLFTDLSQNGDLAENSLSCIGYYIGEDGAPNLNVYDGGFEIEGVVSYSISLYEICLTTTEEYSYFNAIDDEGNEVYVEIRQNINWAYYTIYDSDFNEISSWQGEKAA